MYVKFKVLAVSSILLSACATESLVDYSPIVDPKMINQKKFDKDIIECRSIALQVEADYRKRQNEQAMSNMLAGALAGALTGAVVGSGSDYQSELATYGAVSGMAAGAATNDYTRDIVKYGPRRVIDRCMTNRGHALLNDVGRG